MWAQKGEPVTVTHGEPLVMPADMFADVTTVREAVFQALGTASMCWEKVEGAGVFQSDQAAEIGDQLLATIQRLTGTSPAQVTVSLDDLLAVLAESEGFIDSKDNAAFTRLAAAAGVQ